jgi:hypothetical protein
MNPTVVLGHGEHSSKQADSPEGRSGDFTARCPRGTIGRLVSAA